MSIVYGVCGVVVVRELYFLKAWQKTKNYDAETNNSAVKKKSRLV